MRHGTAPGRLRKPWLVMRQMDYSVSRETALEGNLLESRESPSFRCRYLFAAAWRRRSRRRAQLGKILAKKGNSRKRSPATLAASPMSTFAHRGPEAITTMLNPKDLTLAAWMAAFHNQPAVAESVLNETAKRQAQARKAPRPTTAPVQARQQTK